jgi:uncharacterized Tic20 family protein
VLGFLPSLLILLILGPRSARVKRESTEALNFVLTALIALIALWVLGAVVGVFAGALPSGAAVLFVLLSLLIGLVQFSIWVVVIVFSIVAAVRVNGGESFRYPFALRLVK